MRRNLTGYDLANEIRMARRGGEGRTILVVEGRSDHKFYLPHIDQRKCNIYGREGKFAIIQCIDLLNADASISGYLGIVDVDYDILHGITLVRENLIPVYYGDLERMIFTPKTVNKLLSELGEQCLINDTPEVIYNEVISEASKAGCFRYAASLAEIKFRPNPYRIGFKDVALTAAMPDTASIHIDVKILQAELHKSNRTVFSFDSMFASLGISDNSLSNIPALSLAQGHDIFEIFSIGIERKWGRRSLRADVIESQARIAFEREDFFRTSVYSDIVKWEIKNSPFEILRVA